MNKRNVSFNVHMNIHKESVISFIGKSKIVTGLEVAKFLKVSWNTADKYLLELALEGKVERIKKGSVTLWMKK